MATVKHLYTGYGDPNDNLDLNLTGDEVGNHLYQDLNGSQSVWISTTYDENGQLHHAGWERMILASNLHLPQIDTRPPLFDGELGLSTDRGSLFIAMEDWDSGFALRWRSTGITLGDWYEP